jgi:hypothetical protein
MRDNVQRVLGKLKNWRWKYSFTLERGGDRGGLIFSARGSLFGG